MSQTFFNRLDSIKVIARLNYDSQMTEAER